MERIIKYPLLLSLFAKATPHFLGFFCDDYSLVSRFGKKKTKTNRSAHENNSTYSRSVAARHAKQEKWWKKARFKHAGNAVHVRCKNELFLSWVGKKTVNEVRHGDANPRVFSVFYGNFDILKFSLFWASVYWTSLWVLYSSWFRMGIKQQLIASMAAAITLKSRTYLQNHQFIIADQYTCIQFARLCQFISGFKRRHCLGDY